MSSIVIAINITGALDSEDRDAILRVIAQENVRRLALVPPLPILPSTTAAERRDSYEAILQPRLVAVHAANIEAAVSENAAGTNWQQLRKEWSEATPAQRAAILAFAQAQ